MTHARLELVIDTYLKIISVSIVKTKQTMETVIPIIGDVGQCLVNFGACTIFLSQTNILANTTCKLVNEIALVTDIMQASMPHYHKDSKIRQVVAVTSNDSTLSNNCSTSTGCPILISEIPRDTRFRILCNELQ